MPIREDEDGDVPIARVQLISIRRCADGCSSKYASAATECFSNGAVVSSSRREKEFRGLWKTESATGLVRLICTYHSCKNKI
mmetsp:Transcript_7640/g.10416  ORF Transcript_7640/g.10416 Transcript_7640/m.10416 type:complete len:82 (+) Transcript_7640:479-724(+)